MYVPYALAQHINSCEQEKNIEICSWSENGMYADDAMYTGLARKARKERNTKVKKVRGKAKDEVRTGKAVSKKKKD